jgi:glycine/betaine/sarcosine/D-proline reductase family selenoprotein B
MQDQAAPVGYMERTKNYYRALGYNKDYVWAHHDDVPFVRPNKSAAAMKVALIITAGPGDRSHPDSQNRRQVWSGCVASPPETFDTDTAWDKESTHTNDRETFLPIDASRKLIGEGALGALAESFHTAPTDYSQRKTSDQDAPEILRRLQKEKVDAVVLTALCPVCHQTVSMVARHLEANGIPTVIIGSAKDIVEHCGVPRFVFNDFPLGNPCGYPWDQNMQVATMRLALKVLETATGPRTTVKSPCEWKADDLNWRERYSRVRPEDREKLLAIGDERRRKQSLGYL